MRVEEQVRASSPEKSALLSASAGSGKTHALVNRVIRLLASGALPGGIAAITFTEKAAAQMKDKLFHALADAVWGGKGLAERLGLDEKVGLAKSAEEIFTELTARPDALKVSTIHAFCHALLKRFPLEAGLPAGFSVMDDSEIPIRRDAAARECVDGAIGTHLEEDCWTLGRAGIGLDALKALLVLALNKRSQLFLLEKKLGGPEGLDRMLSDAAEDCRAKAEAIIAGGGHREAAGSIADIHARCGDPDGHVRGLAMLSEFSALESVPQVFSALSSFFYTKELTPRVRPPLKKTALKPREAYAEYEELYTGLREKFSALSALYDELAAARAAEAFIRLFRRAEEIYSSKDYAEGLIDYDDLEISAYRLLTGPEADRILLRLDEKILHYLVDEFQDTGALQWEILERLGSETFSGMGAEGRRMPTFFAVGDKKQSIYRFRKADYRLMDALREKMEGFIPEDRRDFPELVLNFRSAPEVVQVVNETFEKLIDSYPDSKAVRRDAKGSARLRVSADEAEVLAEEVGAAVGLPIWEEGRKELRGAGYGDMAILIRSRAVLPGYEKALRARGIPFKVVGGIGFFLQEEVQAIINILRFIENPADAFALSAFLRSSLFGLSDAKIQNLTHFLLEKRKWGKENHLLLERNCPRAARMLDFAFQAKTGSVGTLVEGIIKESGAIAAFGRSGGPPAILNLEKLVRLTHEFDGRGDAGLQDFIEWAADYREKADLATADVELPGLEQSVTIMTVHAAKGLEFPVVFLPGAGRKPNGSIDRLLISARGAAMPLAIKTSALLGTSTGYDAMREAERLEQDKEETRLLYVAMTRARDHLCIIGGEKYARGSWLEKLYSAAPPSLFGAGFAGPEPGPKEYPYSGGAELKKVTGIRPEEYIDSGLPPRENLAPLLSARAVSWLSPSGTASPLLDEATARFDPMLRGSIIHRCLEARGKTGRYSVQAAAQAEEGFAALAPAERKALVSDIEAALSALLAVPEMKALLSPGDGKYFELPLLMGRDDEIIYGHADLVIVDGAKAAVIDYKTGYTLTPPEAVVEAYRPQLAAYCEAVKDAFGLDAVEAALLLVDRREIIHL